MPTLEELQKQVDELKAWKEQKTRQQFRFPLDQESKNAVQQDVLVFTGQAVEPVTLLTGNTALECRINNRVLWILAEEQP